MQKTRGKEKEKNNDEKMVNINIIKCELQDHHSRKKKKHVSIVCLEFCNNRSTYKWMSPTTLKLVFLVDAINTCRGVESNMIHEQRFASYQGLRALPAFR